MSIVKKLSRYKFLLLPLERLWSSITSIRNWLFDNGYLSIYKSKLPVLSIGNLTVGGNGKTPLAIYLTETLSRIGYSPVVLMRGYGGTEQGPLLVDKMHSSVEVGDEAILIAKETGRPVVIARKRVAGAKFIEEKMLGDLIILDDGFQHRSLHRTVDLVTIFTGSDESRMAFSAPRLLPFGKFRECRDKALKRADIVIFAERRPLDSEEPDEMLARLARLLPKKLPWFRAQLLPKSAHKLDAWSEQLMPTKIKAFSGVANPKGFIDSLQASGFDILDSRFYSDHYKYTQKDLEWLKKWADGTPMVCTPKDGVKLRELGFLDCYELRTQTHVVPEETFLTCIFRLLHEVQTGESDPAVPGNQEDNRLD